MDRGFISLLIASLILLLGLGFVAYYKSQSNKELVISAQAQVEDSCNLNKQVCYSSIPNIGKISFSITPKPIPLVSELSLTVTSDIKNIKQVIVDFKGIDMQMGPNKVVLKEVTSTQFTGKGMLPVCIRYSMNWLASVYIETSDGLYMAPYVFETHK